MSENILDSDLQDSSVSCNHNITQNHINKDSEYPNGILSFDIESNNICDCADDDNDDTTNVREELLKECQQLFEENAKLHEKLENERKKFDTVNNIEENVLLFQTYLDKMCTYSKTLETIEKEERQQKNLLNEMKETEKELKKNKANYEKELAVFLEKLKSTGIGLTFQKSNKPLSENKISKYIQTLQFDLDDLYETQIKHKILTRELEMRTAELESMQKVNGNLHIKDYEKLEIKNQNLADKIIENEDSIDKLKREYIKKQNILKKLLDEENSLKTLYKEKELELNELTELLKKSKIEMINKKKERNILNRKLDMLSNSAYLFDKEFLEDYENCLSQIESLKINYDKIKENKQIAQSIDTKESIDEKVVVGKIKTKPRFHQSAVLRPSIHYN